MLRIVRRLFPFYGGLSEQPNSKSSGRVSRLLLQCNLKILFRLFILLQSEIGVSTIGMRQRQKFRTRCELQDFFIGLLWDFPALICVAHSFTARQTTLELVNRRV